MVFLRNKGNNEIKVDKVKMKNKYNNAGNNYSYMKSKIIKNNKKWWVNAGGSQNYWKIMGI